MTRLQNDGQKYSTWMEGFERTGSPSEGADFLHVAPVWAQTDEFGSENLVKNI